MSEPISSSPHGKRKTNQRTDGNQNSDSIKIIVKVLLDDGKEYSCMITPGTTIGELQKMVTALVGGSAPDVILSQVPTPGGGLIAVAPGCRVLTCLSGVDRMEVTMIGFASREQTEGADLEKQFRQIVERVITAMHVQPSSAVTAGVVVRVQPSSLPAPPLPQQPVKKVVEKKQAKEKESKVAPPASREIDTKPPPTVQKLPTKTPEPVIPAAAFVAVAAQAISAKAPASAKMAPDKKISAVSFATTVSTSTAQAAGSVVVSKSAAPPSASALAALQQVLQDKAGKKALVSAAAVPAGSTAASSVQKSSKVVAVKPVAASQSSQGSPIVVDGDDSPSEDEEDDRVAKRQRGNATDELIAVFKSTPAQSARAPVPKTTPLPPPKAEAAADSSDDSESGSDSDSDDSSESSSGNDAPDSKQSKSGKKTQVKAFLATRSPVIATKPAGYLPTSAMGASKSAAAPSSTDSMQVVDNQTASLKRKSRSKTVPPADSSVVAAGNGEDDAPKEPVGSSPAKKAGGRKKKT